CLTVDIRLRFRVSSLLEIICLHLLQSRKIRVALYVGGLYVCGKIGWESVIKMGLDTQELFFHKNFMYYNPLVLITGVDYASIFYLGPDHLSHKEIWKVL
ncbi:unnamed protein product, partial [Brassica oleracea]